MKAVLCTEFGPPSALRVTEVPAPEPGPDQVVLRTHAAGVNFPDTLIIQNKYQFRPQLPFTPGAECSGTILRMGTSVQGFAVGDKVSAIMTYGAFAQQVAVHASQLIRLPQELGPAELEAAGAFLLTYGTSLHALVQRARCVPGERLLVLGAAGGVGLAAVELGARLGLHVIAAAAGAARLDVARRYGARDTIDYEHEDLRERIKALTGGEGIDIVYDPVGEPHAEAALRSLRWRGRYLVVGFAGGAIPRIALNLPLLKGCEIVGVFWGEFSRREPDALAANTARLLAWLADGSIRPLIGARYSLERTPEALEDLLARRIQGKAVILPNGA